MKDGAAFWINTSITQGTISFTFQGRVGNPPPVAGQAPQPPPTYSYPVGWNMVGYKSTATNLTGTGIHSVGQYLGTIAGSGSTPYNLPITAYIPGQGYAPVYATDNMTPGHGYWVYYNTAGTVTPPPD
jgi:hypothetical protein